MASVDLSSINRAAFAAKEGYWWINLAGLALSLLIAKMSFSAYGSSGFEGSLDKAWVCVTCQGLAIALAILARRALTGQMLPEGLAAAAAAGGCAWWASHGLALAWAKGGDPANGWMVFFLTALEPGIFLLAEHVKEGRQALRVAQERDDRETADALAAARAKDESYRAKPPAQPGDNRAVGERSTVTRLKLVETARLPVDQPGDAGEIAQLPGEPGEVLTVARLAGDQPVEQLPRLTAPDHSAGTFKDAEAHARHLITVEGVRHRNELARRARGLSTYKAARLLDELAPGWREKTAAA